MQKGAKPLSAQPFYVTRSNCLTSILSLPPEPVAAHISSDSFDLRLLPRCTPFHQILLPRQQLTHGRLGGTVLNFALQLRQFLVNLPAAKRLHAALRLLPGALVR